MTSPDGETIRGGHYSRCTLFKGGHLLRKYDVYKIQMQFYIAFNPIPTNLLYMTPNSYTPIFYVCIILFSFLH